MNAQRRRRPFRFVASLQPFLITAVVSVLSGRWLAGHPEPAVSAPGGERNVWAIVDMLHNVAGVALPLVAPLTVFWLAARAICWWFDFGSSAPASVDASTIDDDVVAVEDDDTDGVATMYAESVAAVTEVRLAWFDYEADPILAFKYPQIHDVTHPDTADFIEALAGCPSFEVYPGDTRAVEWVAAADRLIAAWEMCETSAKATGLNAIPASERAVIELAIRMLTKGLDDAATPAERSTFVRRAYELVTPIIANQDVRFVLPSETVAALNVAIRGELTATASAGTVVARSV